MPIKDEEHNIIEYGRVVADNILLLFSHTQEQSALQLMTSQASGISSQ